MGNLLIRRRRLRETFRFLFRKNGLFWQAQRDSNLRLNLLFASQELPLSLLLAQINLRSNRVSRGVIFRADFRYQSARLSSFCMHFLTPLAWEGRPNRLRGQENVPLTPLYIYGYDRLIHRYIGMAAWQRKTFREH
jgi:hypothetical protein